MKSETKLCVKLYPFHGSCFSPPKKSRAIKKSISKFNECVITYIQRIFFNCVMCRLWKSKEIFPEQDYAWAWLVKCWICWSWSSFPTYVILWCYESMISWQRRDVQHRSPLNLRSTPITLRVPPCCLDCTSQNQRNQCQTRALLIGDINLVAAFPWLTAVLPAVLIA